MELKDKIKTFNQFENNLHEDGYIITDNMFFHGYVEMREEDIQNKNLRSLVRKIKTIMIFYKI